MVFKKIFKKLLPRMKGEKEPPITPDNQGLSTSVAEASSYQNTASSPVVAEQAAPIHSIATSNDLQPAQLMQSLPDTFNRTDKYGLFPMNPQNSHSNDTESEENYLLDIVAIHGITGDAYDTWTHKNGKLWLRDYVPEDFPGARVFSFGYDAEVFFSRSQGTIESFARSLLEGLTRERVGEKNQLRRIIFICHSMGGIVVKKAFIIARLDREDYGNITDSVSAILFLATPHRGSGETQLPLVLAKIGNIALAGTARFIGRTRADLIESLERDSGGLKGISTDFRNQMGNVKIASFIETDITPPAKGRIVDDISGIMDIPRERIVYMVGCDHKSICRFSDRTGNSYKTVLGLLKLWAEEARRVTIVEPPEDPRQRYRFTATIFQNARRFIPRPKLSSRIEEQLNGPEPRYCVLLGMGGIGKSEMALSIAEKFRDHRHVFWVDCQSDAVMLQNYIAIGQELFSQSAMAVSQIRAILSDRDDWLLIFDNVDDDTVLTTIKISMLPASRKDSSNGSILFTGRLGTLRTIREPIDIPLFCIQEGRDLLAACCPAIDASDSMAASLVLELGRLPLAIEHAANYMAESGDSLQDYIKRYAAEAKKTEFLQEEPPASPYTKPLLLTWKVTFDKIGQNEKLVFNALAGVRPDGVDENFLKQGAISNPPAPWSATSSIPDFERGVPLPEKYAAVLSSPTELRRALNTLLRLSLLRKSDKKYTMHSLVQLWAKERLDQNLRKEQPAIALCLTTNNLANLSDIEIVSNGDHLHYAKVCVQNLSATAGDLGELPEEVLAKPCFYIGRAYWLMHENATALSFFQQAERNSEIAFGARNAWTLWACHNLGLIFRERGDYDRARIYFQKAVDGMSSTFGESAHDTLVAESNLSATIDFADHLNDNPSFQTETNDAEPKIMPIDQSVTRTQAFSLFIKDIDRHAEEKITRRQELLSQIASAISSRDSACELCEDMKEAGRFYYELARISRAPIRQRSSGTLTFTSIHLRAATLILLCRLTDAMEHYNRTSLTPDKSSGPMKTQENRAVLLGFEFNRKLLANILGGRPELGHDHRGSFDRGLSSLAQKLTESGGIGGEVMMLSTILARYQLKSAYRMEGDREMGHSFPHCAIPYALDESLPSSVRSTASYTSYPGQFRDIWESSNFDFNALIEGEINIISEQAKAAFAACYFVQAILAHVLVGDNDKARALYTSIIKAIIESAFTDSIKYRRHESQISALLFRRPFANLGVDLNTTKNLEIAAENNNLAITVILLDNVSGGIGDALNHAAASGSIGVVKLLIERGADVNNSSWRGSPIYLAAGKGHVEVVRLLLENGSSFAGDGYLQDTALHGAAQYGQASVAALLVEKGIDVNATNFVGRTALSLAAALGHRSVVEILLKGGADISVGHTKHGDTVVEASEHGHKEIVQLLKAHASEANSTSAEQVVRRGR